MPAHERVVTGERLAVLDIVRLVAALMVVVWHFDDNVGGNLGKSTYVVAHHGWMGVELFFLVSGFVICMSSWGRTLGEFFVSRVVRLYPAYWFAVLLTTAVVAMWPVHQPPMSVRETLGNLTMLQELLGISHLDSSYWTLAVELQFYLLFAFVVRRRVTYRRVVGFCVWWTVAGLILPHLNIEWLGKLVAAEYSQYFVAGIAMYLIYRYGPTLLLGFIVALSYVLALVRLSGPLSWAPVTFGSSAAVVTVFFVVLLAVALGGFRWFRARWSTALGTLTYPLYLMHQSVGLTLIKRVRPAGEGWPLFLGGIAVMTTAAWLVHRLVERPVSKIMKRALLRSLEAMRAVREPDDGVA